MKDPRHRALPRRRLAASILSTALPALLAVTSVRADDVVTRGARIRVTSPTRDARPVIGTLVNLERDTLTMIAMSDSHAVALPVASVRALEISRGRVTHLDRDAGIGFLVGAGAGALIGAAEYTPRRPQGFEIVLFDSRGTHAAAGAVVGGLVGLGLGLAVGSHGSERWVGVDPASVRITWLPVSRGAAFSASVRF
jgi:hypothetical protein